MNLLPLILTALALTLPLAGAKAQTCTTPPPGLVAWWSGDGYPLDLAGTNNGTPQGGVSYQPAKVGAGFPFDSNDDRVVVPYNQVLDVSPSGFACAFWMRGGKSQPELRAALVEKSHGYVDNTGWAFHAFNDDGRVHFAVGRGGGLPASNFAEAISTGDLLDNQFHHIVGTWDGAVMALYVDGQFQTTTPLTAPVNNVRPLNLGFSWGAGTPQRFFRGALDEVTLFNRALTTNEITAIHAAGSAGMCKLPQWTTNTLPSGLIAWWPANGNFLDAVGTNHGAPYGAVSFALGQAGASFSFDGIGQCVRISNSASLNPPASFSIEAWVRPTRSADQIIFGKWGDAGDYANQRSYILSLGANNSAAFGISDAANQNNTSFHSFYSPANSVPTNVWSHVVGIYDQSTGKRRIYINGVLTAERTDAPITILNGSAVVGLGAYLPQSTAAASFFGGQIDDTRLYHRALAANEIVALAGSGPSLVAAQTTGSIALSWPAAYISYDLVSRTNLAAGTWESLTNTPATNGMWKEVLLPTSDAQGFFRLKSGN